MKKLLTAIAITTLFSSAAMAASSSDVTLQVSQRYNNAIVTVEQDGQPLTDYPVTIDGMGSRQVMTNDHGQLHFANHYNNVQSYTFTINDQNGNAISKTVSIIGDKN
ncbi:Ig-like domain-containing protein [Vibrio hibernica]|uniref:Ig-like domain-containing protein n=1 Tax=Vibrio hibernica TaxID=2587465 RepID=UPI001881D1C9|nr:hypothetical protein [Vibrio hibernica]